MCAVAKDVLKQDYCVPSIDLSTTALTVKQIVDREFCPYFTIPTAAVLGRCLPKIGSLNEIPESFVLPGISSPNETADAIRNATGQATLFHRACQRWRDSHTVPSSELLKPRIRSLSHLSQREPLEDAQLPPKLSITKETVNLNDRKED
ncbi:hypothetical protein SKAU_G00406260 [Synaphobranchus kaupii]|uniref:Uncharacterized protein n=1 Tax=Synaphobranchus kaupii TaxID=118154 RepID=A0A9Q1EA61_SYNKA|nr:hypothetical protein SKAU_G00406260 [Synaphobranchus kaupii]